MTTREEFELSYGKRSKISLVDLAERGYLAVPCVGCDFDKCDGWKMATEESLDFDLLTGKLAPEDLDEARQHRLDLIERGA